MPRQDGGLDQAGGRGNEFERTNFRRLVNKYTDELENEAFSIEIKSNSFFFFSNLILRILFDNLVDMDPFTIMVSHSEISGYC